jgi:uncharacterized alpha-E superfamily protein
MQESLHAITSTPIGSYHNEAERLVGRLRANLDYAGIDSIMEGGLHEYLDALQLTLNDIGVAIGERFFGHPPAQVEQTQSQSLH